MPYPTVTLLPRSRFAQMHVADGITRSVLKILDHRGIALTPAARGYISGCLDLDLAKTWLDEALTATSYTDLTYLAVL